MEAARPAVPADLAEIERLRDLGRTAIADARGGALWLDRDAPSPDRYESSLETKNEIVVVGTIDDVPVGFVLASADTTTGSRPIAVVHELFVHPEARGVGVGEVMMNTLVDWAVEAGCLGVDGYALPGDRATKNFFETFGLVARGIVVHRSLEP